jgi:uncharacterized membrane protein YvlD (DUF360 family)
VRAAFRNPVRRLGVLWLDVVRALLAAPFGTPRLAIRILLIWLVETAALLGVAWLAPGIDVGGFIPAVLAIILTHVLMATVRPVLIYLILPLVVLTAGLLAIPVNALMLLAAGSIVPDVHIDGLGWALVGWLAITAVNMAAAWLVDLGEEGSYYRTVATLLATRGRRVRTSDRPGLVVVQIDGLGHGVLEHAIRSGQVPTMARWLREGSHRLARWEVALPSQTSASQAGILMGDNDDIPAFRWYEKEAGRLLVSNRPVDAATIERRHSNGRGLLALNGSSIGNLVSGDATRTVLTASSVTDLRPGVGRRSRDFLLFLLNPYTSTRVVYRMSREIIVEFWQARRQRRRDVEPRMHRGGAFPLLRAVACVLLRDLSTMLVIEDMHRGVAITYTDYVGYDEVAHHAGPERPEALDALADIDRELEAMEIAARSAPRPYRFVILSDHGQSMGSTFLQRRGRTLEALLRASMGTGAEVRAATGPAESWGRLNGFLSEVLTDGGPFAGLFRRVLGRAGGAGDSAEVELGPDDTTGDERSADSEAPGDRGERSADTVAARPDLVVCASGNLALVYLADRPGRLTLDAIEAAHPGLLAELVAEPWVGLVMVRSATDGAVVLGPGGRHRLADGAVDGIDPLIPFGPLAADHLRRLDGFSNVGDLVINSAIDPVTGQVAAFEELIGSHGGLGGPQTAAFLLAPADVPWPETTIVGAPALSRVLRSWLPTGEVPLDEPAVDGDAEEGQDERAASSAAGSSRLPS